MLPDSMFCHPSPRELHQLSADHLVGQAHLPASARHLRNLPRFIGNGHEKSVQNLRISEISINNHKKKSEGFNLTF